MALAVRTRRRSFLINERVANGRAVPVEPLIIDFCNEETSLENGQRAGLSNTRMAKGLGHPFGRNEIIFHASHYAMPASRRVVKGTWQQMAGSCFCLWPLIGWGLAK